MNTINVTIDGEIYVAVEGENLTCEQCDIYERCLQQQEINLLGGEVFVNICNMTGIKKAVLKKVI